MDNKRCAACAQVFTPRRNVPDQRYCSKPECQRARRRRWQRHKRKADPDYQANQAAAQRRWRERHREYWRWYRQQHPEYAARNREQQHGRNRRRRTAGTGPSPAVIAKMDAYTAQRPMASGTYRLIPVAGPGIAKMDEYLVQMHVLSAS